MVNTPPILPPTSPVTPGPSAVGHGQNPPLPQLPAGTVLTGTVSAQDASGNTTILTDSLKLVLKTDYPLPKGAEVSVRLDRTLAAHLGNGKTANVQPQQVQIVQVDGKPAQPAPPAAGGAVNAAAQRELARPVGMLLDAMPRGGAPKPEAAPAQPAPVRAAQAAEVLLSEGQRATAVMLRPAVSGRAGALLTQLGAQTATPIPASPTSVLRPGLQLQVQVVPPPATSAAATVPASPVSTSGAPATSPTVPAPAGTTPATPLPAATALPPVMRSGYASYARQAPAMQPGAPPPMQPQSAQVQPTQTQPVQPRAIATGAAQTPPLASAGAPSASPATPVQVPPALTPQAVEQLLLRAEAQPLPQGHMPAVVLGKEQGGALIVQTRLGMFTLPQVSAEAAQPGTVLNWQVRGMQLPAQPAEGLPALGQSQLLAATAGLTAEWSALDELTSVLQSMQSGMAAQALQRAVPHVGSQMGAGLLFFMSILRKGDVHEWLGRDLTHQLERMGKGDLVQRLGGDLAAVRSFFVDQPPGQWQAMFFPVMVEGKLEHAQLFLKQDGEEEKKKGGGGTRFVVELELSHLGPMQIDGFIKKRESATQFDLVLRTMAELPDTMRTDIYGIFDNAQKVAGFNGSLNFRLVSEFPVRPLEEMQQARGGEGGIMA